VLSTTDPRELKVKLLRPKKKKHAEHQSPFANCLALHNFLFHVLHGDLRTPRLATPPARRADEHEVARMHTSTLTPPIHSNIYQYFPFLFCRDGTSASAPDDSSPTFLACFLLVLALASPRRNPLLHNRHRRSLLLGRGRCQCAHTCAIRRRARAPYVASLLGRVPLSTNDGAG